MGYADELQAVSVDEALIDATGAVAARASAPQEAEKAEEADAEDIREHMGEEDGEVAQPQEPKKERDPAVEVAEQIRDEMRRETGCEGECINAAR
jgi:DNA repair protein REV1